MNNNVFMVLITASLHASWELSDSVSVSCRVPAKSRVCIEIDTDSGKLSIIPAQTTGKLTAKARQAIAFSPSWLTIALEDKFASLNASRQDSYADVILNARDPVVDEVAFTVAHLPVEVINSKGFYPEVITENALGVYRADSALEYVEIIDSGSAASGGDYFSTTRYRVKKTGVTEDYTLPRDFYYWFVVHPKLQGELPTYVMPDDPNPAAPPQGKFWRTYFLTNRSGNTGSILDSLKGVSFLWANKVNSIAENGALGRLSQWCNSVLPWGGGTPQYRWPQPVYIYNQHKGTCSEHGWFANAAARSALIPVTLTKAPRFDHKWNEFYCGGRWIDWEPINGWIARVDEPSHADDYWADPAKPPLNGCFNWRGDGFIWGTTEHYSKVCTLSVSVADAAGFPVDGARITVDAEGVPGNFLMAGWTGSDGKCGFLLGDGVPYFTASVKSAAGDIAAVTVITNSVAGKRYDWPVRVAGTLPKVNAYQVDLPVEPEKDAAYRIEFSLDAGREIVYGRHEYSLYGYSFPCTFSDERSGGSVDFYICNRENFSACTSGAGFKAVVLKAYTAAADSFVTIPAGDGRWYAVVSADRKTTNTSIAKLSMLLYRQNRSAVRPTVEERNDNQGIIKVDVKGSLLRCYFPQTARGRVKALLFDALGKPVAVLYEGAAEMSLPPVTFDLHSIHPGIYFFKLLYERQSFSSKIVVVNTR